MLKSVGKLERTVSQVPSVIAFNQIAPDATNVGESIRILLRYTVNACSTSICICSHSKSNLFCSICLTVVALSIFFLIIFSFVYF